MNSTYVMLKPERVCTEINQFTYKKKELNVVKYGQPRSYVKNRN